ncbi:hypothetical protein T484DRAFT_1882871 [Baffinella frigidus]|nr:hypothetical protein T484DRAFT_1882871 [Cryptophyta sp. CCMP2293]
MTAHTVPKALRHLDEHTEELDIELYKNLRETQRIVFNPPRAVTAKRKDLMVLMDWFTHYGMMPKIQRELVRNNGVTTIVYLGLIEPAQSEHARCAALVKLGRREPNRKLALAGCRMLLGAARSNQKIRRKANDLGVIRELLTMVRCPNP